MPCFRELKDVALGFVRARDANVLPSPLERLAGGWLNQTYLQWITESRVSTESSLYQTTQTTGDTLITDVPVDFLTMVNFRVLSRNSDTSYMKVLVEKTPDELDRMFPNRAATPNTAATPTYFTINRTSHPKETGDATTLTVRSTSTADAGAAAPLISLVGYPNATRDRELHQQVTGNGTTNVSIGTPIRTILSFSKDRDTTGYVQLRDGSSNVLAELMPWQRSSHLVVIEPFSYVDSSTTLITYEMRYNRRPPVMLNDADVPFFIPEEYHMGLAYSALAEFGASYVDDSRLGDLVQLADRWKQRFRSLRRSKDVASGGFKWNRS